jgi:hypothetical protein
VGSLAELYAGGAHREVWEELVALGPDVFTPSYRAAADEVAALTMQRAATNVATIVVRLSLMGYRFRSRHDHNRRRRTIEDLGLRDSMEKAGRDVAWVDAGEVEEHVMGWVAPGASVDAQLARTEDALGPLPLSLVALTRLVDVVDLRGSFPQWDPSAYDFDDDPDWPSVGLISDPLNLTGIETLNDCLLPDRNTVDPGLAETDGSVYAHIGSDYLLSANVAGGFHTVRLPDPVADPMVIGVCKRPGIRLVEYLRVAFEWGGFPGFEFADSVPEEIDILRRDLLPI